MIYKLGINHVVENRDEVAYARLEIKKAQETLQELCKDKEKYKDKIRILAQHIRNLREAGLMQESYEVNLSRNGLSKDLYVGRFDNIHESLVNAKNYMNETIREKRRVLKAKPVTKAAYGMKIYEKIGSKKKGFVFAKAGTIMDLLKSKKIKVIKDPKVPFNKENHIGVEIEFASYLSEEQIGQIFYEAGLIKYVQLQKEYIDGRGDGEKPYELCVVAPETEIFSIIEQVCTILNEKLDANITYGCGLHVHIDARNRDVRKMFDNLFACQEVLYNMVAYTRRHNRHVQIMDKKNWLPGRDGFRHNKQCKEEKCVCTFAGVEDFKAKAYRYFGINTWSYISHKTLEVRIHSGSSNATKINNWIKLLLNIVDGKQIKGYIKDIEEFKTAVKLDAKLLNYVENRIEYFKREEA